MSQSAESKSNRSLLLPPIMLAILLGSILLYLVIPGNLIYPVKRDVIQEKIPLSPTVQSEIKKNLITRINDLENAIQNGVCTEQGYILDNSEISLLPPPAASANQAYKPSLLIPPASHLNFEGNNLLDHLKSSTVFIAGENGAGSGFFVNENYVVTNAHVVKGQGNQFKLISPIKDGPFNATLIGITADLENSNEDYAILKSEITSEKYLSFSNDIKNLQMTNIIAAGFPSDFFETLDEIESYGSGLETELIPLFVTNGMVSATQNFTSGGGIVIHSAEIAPGSSGGPLVNPCGVIVGMNTMGFGYETRTLYVSLRSDGLKSFLKEQGINFSEQVGTCNPKRADETQD